MPHAHASEVRGVPYTILEGDCLATLKTLPDGCVQCCISSPPYLNLRSYLPNDHPDKNKEVGWQQSPDEYVAKLVDVFREVRRVLREDGTLWLNLAASWNGSGGAGGDYGEGGLREGQPKFKGNKAAEYKPKDMIPVPWLVAIALQQDGYYLRSDIIWHKTAPMPGSYDDRPTVAHEYLCLFSKNPNYYYDADSIREPNKPESLKRWHGEKKPSEQGRNNPAVSPQGINTLHKIKSGDVLNPAGANRRSVWTLGPERAGIEHYATMPTKLVEPCILAGSKPGDLVLDPFNGAATTGLVALKHGRKYIGCELNPDYITLSHKRLLGVASQQRLFEVA